MYSTRDFASRIKGGHSNSKICISEEKINVIDYKTDILIAFDQATLDDYINELEIENQRIEMLEENIEDLHGDLSWKDDEIENLENEVYELENEVDSLKRELENIER